MRKNEDCGSPISSNNNELKNFPEETNVKRKIKIRLCNCCTCRDMSPEESEVIIYV